VFLVIRKFTGNGRLPYLNRGTGKSRNYPHIGLSAGFFNNAANKIGTIFRRFAGITFKEKYRDMVNSLNVISRTSLSFNTILGYKIISGFVSGMLAVVLLKTVFTALPGFFCFFAAGFFIPDFFLKRAVKNRLEEFESELPYTIDLLYIATLSGQNIFNSIRILTEKYRGSVSVELGRFLKEINFGIGRSEAYKNALNRNKAESFKNLLFLLIQAEKFGSSISEVLRQKSKFLRFEIAQKYEIRSRRISILLLFPLVFLILPAFVLLVGGPLVFSIAGSFVFS
jgi:tight adherence protein C